MPVPSSTEWPIVGGEYRWTGDHNPKWRSRVESIDADGMIHYFFVQEGVVHGTIKFTSLRAFRNGHFPEDQSPIPELVKALKALLQSGLTLGNVDQAVQSLALAGETSGEENEDAG